MSDYLDCEDCEESPFGFVPDIEDFEDEEVFEPKVSKVAKAMEIPPQMVALMHRLGIELPYNGKLTAFPSKKVTNAVCVIIQEKGEEVVSQRTRGKIDPIELKFRGGQLVAINRK